MNVEKKTKGMWKERIELGKRVYYVSLYIRIIKQYQRFRGSPERKKSQGQQHTQHLRTVCAFISYRTQCDHLHYIPV